jgi:molybdopterin molybdotransferase
MKSYPTQISVAEAIAILQARAKPVQTIALPLLESYGHVLAEDVTALVDHPSATNSAMDGYACRLEDTLSASETTPVRLELVGDIPAGQSYHHTLGKNQAVGIYTGASMPKGTDAVVPVEVTRADNNHVILSKPADPANVRPKGQDFQAGQTLLKSGLKLDAASVGLAAAMGHAKLNVRRKPRVGILATGDEVIEPGKPLTEGHVYNSNTFSIAGLIRAAGATPIVLPHVRDDRTLLAQALENTEQLDLLLTSGGVSMGKFDFVRDLLFEGGEVYFWKVAMKPAGPVLFGQWNNLPVLGLPGNPVSSMIAFLLLVNAYLQTTTGSTEPLPYYSRQQVITTTDLKGAGSKEHFPRVRLEFQNNHWQATSTGNQSSGVLSSMLLADALAIIPPHTHYQKGDHLEVIALGEYV